MGNNLSSCKIITFQAVDEVETQLSDFLDDFFEVNALNYTDDGKEEYVGYADMAFDPETLKKAAKAAGVVLPEYRLEILENKNWLTENVIKFEPVETTDFYVYGVHEKTTPTTDKLPIRIYAATAFGSSHQTTHSCLEAISDLNKMAAAHQRILDIGTGSGILSLACAKLWEKDAPEILGIDIDQEAVNVAAQNAEDNHVAHLLEFEKSDGGLSGSVIERAPYDIILANILARPLIEMAPEIYQNLKPGGYCVLSGFVDNQVSWLLDSFDKAGLKLVRMYHIENWYAAIVQKPLTLLQIQQTLQPYSDRAVLVVRNNLFLGADILEKENKIKELTGFSGSAGTLLIFKDEVFLLVDGRYTIAAKNEVPAQIKLADVSGYDMCTVVELCRRKGIKLLTCNPWCLSVKDAAYLKKSGLELIEDEKAPASYAYPNQGVFTHQLKFCGLSKAQKCRQTCDEFSANTDALLIGSSEELSWLSNLRSHTLPETPVLRGFGLLGKNGKLKIFDISNINEISKVLCRYKNISSDVMTRPLIFDRLAGDKTTFLNEQSPVMLLKLSKNQTEINGFKNAHIQDGIAVSKFLYWLEKQTEKITELDVVHKLHEFRRQRKYFFSESFGTIAATGSNAAIVHYQPHEKTNRVLEKESVLLLDSGGQYDNGTTDVTRTIALGKVPDEIRQSFTQVLKAHLALSSLEFPAETSGLALDSVCRSVLWRFSKQYRHGTGHSVGYFSNVHERGFALSRQNMPARENYVTSIEPGYYVENQYGIRIENMYYLTPSLKKGFLKFENLTLVPIDKRLIDKYLLTDGEKDLLNAYHQKVYDCLVGYLNLNERKWLKDVCSPI